MSSLITYIDHLQKQNPDEFAFYPLATLETALESGYVRTCKENDEYAGYFWHGPLRPGRDIVGYQIAIDYSARRRHLGWAMVAELLSMGGIAGCLGLRLHCASSNDSNLFWKELGFHCTKVTMGGVKRGRYINHWRTDIQPALFTLPSVTPSTKSIDRSEYRRKKRAGVLMPSPWSRRHY